MATKKYAPIGTVSHGTMREEDLLDSFSAELSHAMRNYIWQGMTDKTEAFARFSQMIEDSASVAPESEDAMRLIDELFDALDSFSPPYTSFGANEGDGADYGWWPIIDAESLEDARDSGYRVEISDHGNVALYDSHGREVWSII